MKKRADNRYNIGLLKLDYMNKWAYLSLSICIVFYTYGGYVTDRSRKTRYVHHDQHFGILLGDDMIWCS